MTPGMQPVERRCSRGDKHAATNDNCGMLHYRKFRDDLFAPAAARDIYTKRPAGKGWPEECPPFRAANSFGWDILANFDITFIRTRTGWKISPDITIESDFAYAANEESEGAPLEQQYAWFWQRGQKIPHPITDNVFAQIKNQVKISSYLFLKTDPGENLLLTDVPNLVRPWRAVSALVETDWYPASYPWHCVIELDPKQKRIKIRKGEPLCRLIPVRRDTYFANGMSPTEFDDFFARGQRWLAQHGRSEHEGVVDITHTYSRQQSRSRFIVLP
ncbi:MAG TPA: DUF6065 family protein [Tepidisphaeraceae bacterium]|nr:DUF6065 family protein [Tepidisphaeraceae bacterium]